MIPTRKTHGLERRCCRIAKTERNFLAASDGYTKDLRSLVLRSFLGRATVARPPQRACQDACRKGTGSAASSPRGSRGGDRGGCFRQVLERVRRVRGERRSFARDTVRSAPSLLPPLFSRTLPLPWKDDLVTALSDCAWTNVRRRRTTSRGVGGPTPQFPGTTADDDAERVDNAASRF